ncbi:MAG: 3-oxoacyl-ACP reductase FabG [Opitutae bacterium]|nr:3-oxoacyl-ACP reductase FabG [Opitutae bacterium]MBT5690148.1 3-oxoacyl-ACP reductase FabG [Opitutae bacterium]MBT7854600.1 3-oxoacyl-ACP reductase FabG [Opitutae bacterium]
MAFSLDGHVALVTGSSRGLGKGIVKELARAGARVAVNYFNQPEPAHATIDEIRKAGGVAMLVRADASDPEQVPYMVEAVAEKFGPVDILVPNATPDQPQNPIEEYDAEFYQQMLDFFILSPFHLAQAVVPCMKEKGWGRIINVTSSAYHAAFPNFSAYIAAKGGQIGWSRSMSVELAPSGITVNTVAPGWIPTERHDNDPQEQKDAYFDTVPAGRWGTPEDVAHAVQFFASSEASFITGQTLCVTGGLTPW